MTIVAIVKCKNGYIALVKEDSNMIYSGDWKPDAAHVFLEYADLVDFLYSLFGLPEEKKPA